MSNKFQCITLYSCRLWYSSVIIHPNYIIGYKDTIYEGGTRVPGFIHSPLLYKSGYVSTAMVHVTDWFPTILRLAGAPEADIKVLDIDGIDQYDTFFAYDATGNER